MEKFEGKNHGLTCREIRIELCNLLRSRREMIEIYRRKRSWLDSERAMAIAGTMAEIRALESVLPPPLDTPYNGQNDAA
jgi:hypothetical protein